jgi:hypothetical protein
MSALGHVSVDAFSSPRQGNPAREIAANIDGDGRKTADPSVLQNHAPVLRIVIYRHYDVFRPIVRDLHLKTFVAQGHAGEKHAGKKQGYAADKYHGSSPDAHFVTLHAAERLQLELTHKGIVAKDDERQIGCGSAPTHVMLTHGTN